MTTQSKAAAGFITFVLGFLLGFVPQYLQKNQLQSELTVSREKLGQSELRDLAGLMLLAVLRQNYGDARDYSTKYFDGLRATSDQAQDAALKSSLQELLGKRDSTITKLAKGDPSSTDGPYPPWCKWLSYRCWRDRACRRSA